MQDTGFNYNTNGVSLPIVRDNDGDIYLYDPQHRMNAPHYARRESTGVQMGSLGLSTDQGVQLAAQAANLIPGVGQILSAALQIGDAIFGGGDPTPLSSLMNQIVQSRGAIAEINRGMGVADTFTIPADFDPLDKDKERAFVDAIVTAAIGASEAQIQGDRRKDYYNAISVLADALKQAQGTAHDQDVTSSVVGSLLPVLQAQQQELDALRAVPASNVIPFPQNIPSTDDSPLPAIATTDATTLTTTDYLLIAGGVGILLVVAVRLMR